MLRYVGAEEHSTDFAAFVQRPAPRGRVNMREQQISAMLRHHAGFVKRYVKVPAEKAYFIESFCRLDSLLDELVITLLMASYPHGHSVFVRLNKNQAWIPTRVAQTLKDFGIIDKTTLKNLYAFKNYRNIAAHNVHGDLDLAREALKETGFQDKPGVCFNCSECMNKHLNSMGYTSLDDYSKVALKKRIALGLSIYKELTAAFYKKANNPKS